MPDEPIVIVGAGHAGFQLAASLRQHGFEDGITLLSDEEVLPYQRPPLSKDYLDGRATSSASDSAMWTASGSGMPAIRTTIGTPYAPFERYRMRAASSTRHEDKRHLRILTGPSQATRCCDSRGSIPTTAGSTRCRASTSRFCAV